MNIITHLIIRHKLKNAVPFELKPNYGTLGVRYGTKDGRIMIVTSKITTVVYDETFETVPVKEFLACLEKEKQ